MAVPTSLTPSRYCVFVVMDRQGQIYRVSGIVPENLEYHNKIEVSGMEYLEMNCADPIESNEGDLGLASFWVDFWRQPRGFGQVLEGCFERLSWRRAFSSLILFARIFPGVAANGALQSDDFGKRGSFSFDP